MKQIVTAETQNGWLACPQHPIPVAHALTIPPHEVATREQKCGVTPVTIASNSLPILLVIATAAIRFPYCTLSLEQQYHKTCK